MKRHYDVCFLCDEQAGEYLALLDDKSEEEVLARILDEIPHEHCNNGFVDREDGEYGHGSSDSVFERGDGYILSHNTDLRYLGVVFVEPIIPDTVPDEKPADPFAIPENPEEPTDDEPSIDTMTGWSDRAGCEATDGCWVETDGWCEHGHVSWLIYLGLT